MLLEEGTVRKLDEYIMRLSTEKPFVQEII
jgi:hypothetical protein